jgi:formate hydrogenlyase subunit 3/multisubunit Na+/H+ antiporter MnhD subunit
MLASIAFLGAITVAIGLMAEPLAHYAMVAGAELADPEGYIDRILPEPPGPVVADAEAIEGGAE